MISITAGLLILALGRIPVDHFRPPQGAPTGASQPRSQFFSGTVVAATKNEVTVIRTGLSRNSETRTFKIDAATSIEGSLKVKSRVTVRYVDDHAVHIIVRPPKK